MPDRNAGTGWLSPPGVSFKKQEGFFEARRGKFPSRGAQEHVPQQKGNALKQVFVQYRSISLVLLIIMMLNGQESVAQFFRPECKETVWNYYKKGLVGVNIPEGKKVHYYHINFQTVPADNKTYSNTSVNVKIYMSAEQVHYLSDEVLVYQDRKDAFMVAKKQGIIVRSESGLNNDNQEFLENFQVFTDSVFITSKTVGCRETINDKKEKLLIVTLEMSKEACGALNVTRITYQVNKTRNKIEKVTMYYVKGHKYKKTVLVHLETDLNAKRKMNIPVVNYLYDSNGKLYNKFKNYRYIDNRNQNF